MTNSFPTRRSSDLSQKGGILMQHQRSEMQLARASLDAMITMDAPAHMQLRREHMPYFTPAYLRGLTDRIEGEVRRSEEHTSELQSLMRISYAVFCLKKKNKTQQ